MAQAPEIVQIPVPVASPSPLSKREQIATEIASCIWSNPCAFGPIFYGKPSVVAAYAVNAADALLAALVKNPPDPLPTWDPTKL